MQFTYVVAASEITNPLIPNLAEMAVAIVAFAVLFWIVIKKVSPSFEKIYAQRTEAIEGGLAKAERAQAEAAEALENYTRKLNAARGEAAKIIGNAEVEGEKILADFRDRANLEAKRILDNSKERISAAHAVALKDLHSEVGFLALDLANKIVGESLADTARSGRIVERFLVELDTKNAVKQEN